MSNSTRRIISIAFSCTAAALLLASLSLPVWKMHMESPQYQGSESLNVAVYPGSMRGDLKEIELIDKYIGVKIPHDLPQLQWLPATLVAGAVLGLLALFLPMRLRPRALSGTAVALSAALVAAAALAQMQMYQIGHNRVRGPMAGVHDFTTPLIGDLKVANFHIKSRLGLGAFVIGGAIVLQILAGRFASVKLAGQNASSNRRPSALGSLPPGITQSLPQTGHATSHR